MVPTFIIVGAMKTGSTSLAGYLRVHPDVFMTTPKEPSLFSRNWDRGTEWYESLFDGADASVARGEASTSYTKAYEWPGVPARMAQVVPEAKLIYLVRHPADRIRSQYVHNCAHRNERRPIERAVREDPAYIDFSSYARQASLLLEHYDRDQLLVLSTEELRCQRATLLERVCRFIGVRTDVDIDGVDLHLNQGADKRRSPGWLESARVGLNRVGVAPRFPDRWRAWAYDRMRFQPILAELDDELAGWIRARLADDEEELRALVGPNFPMWTWT